MAARPGEEFYCIDTLTLEPNELVNALKALLEGRLALYVSVGRDAGGKAHGFRFSQTSKMSPLHTLEPGDEEIFLPMMATRFQKSVARVRYDVAATEGVLHISDPKGELTATTYKLEPLPPFPGRLFERPLTWGDPVWLGSGPPAGRPERPPPNTPGYDLPLEAGSHIGGFASWQGASLDALRTEIDRAATGELTLKAADGVEARFWMEQGQVVGFAFDPMRGQPAEKQWEAVAAEPFAQRRFRIDVPRPEHIAALKNFNAKILPKK